MSVSRIHVTWVSRDGPGQAGGYMRTLDNELDVVPKS
jgi:hypothetical protein